MQRLFSTFANGWPGIGLLLQRLLIGAILIYCALVQTKEVPHLPLVIAQMLAAILLMIGFGTPLVGSIVAGLELWIVFSGSANPWIAITSVGLAATLAMIGPGAWSVDARLFGRKHIEFRKR